MHGFRGFLRPKSGAEKEQIQKHLSRNFTMSGKDRIPAEVFILVQLEELKTALSDSPLLL